MKLVLRADDFGYTEIHNLGAVECLNNGVVTSVDLMLDTPGTEDAIEKIKAYPWISIGWHSHFWGRPVLDPSEVPSMVDSSGRFHFGWKGNLKYEGETGPHIGPQTRQELKEIQMNIVYEEALKECRAEILRCIRLLGKAPDTAWVGDQNNPLERAKLAVCEEFGIAYNFAIKPKVDGTGGEEFLNEKFKDTRIYFPEQGSTDYAPLVSTSGLMADVAKYDPVQCFIDDANHILDRDTVILSYHPAYLDPYVYDDSHPGFMCARLLDVKALCSDRLKRWIIENKVELINHRDAIYGTHEYQNHLKAIGSDLCMR